MSNLGSVVEEVLQLFPEKRPQLYFKSSLIALSHAMEDQVLAGGGDALVIASFQREKFYKQEAHRYLKIGQKCSHVYVLAAPESDFDNSSEVYEKIAFSPDDPLAQEWHLVVLTAHYTGCLVCREKTYIDAVEAVMDNSRRFEGIWTCEQRVSRKAALILLRRILYYRPQLSEKVEKTIATYCLEEEEEVGVEQEGNSDPFVQRLITYLQAGQYKLMKAYGQLAAKEKKERLLNSVTTAIRHSMDPDEILRLCVEKLGEGFGVCRCLIYRCQEEDTEAEIEHEFIREGVTSVRGYLWPLRDNLLFREVVAQKESVSIDDVKADARICGDAKVLLPLVNSCCIVSWLIVPILYRGRLLGMIELHHCRGNPVNWKQEDIALVNTIATQVGVALIQAESYAHLEELNEQLEALDRTRSNLVAITGHELRTPLSTIQVCLESLANEPDMSEELKQVMLSTALHDAERMRQLIQDFLTLSQLESGNIQWHPEPLSLQECIDLSISQIRSRARGNSLPQIVTDFDSSLPLVQADGEWLVEVLSKLLDNACKFTNSNGIVTISVKERDSHTLEVTVADNGRGIEPELLDKVFERFYQEEGALRRSKGGTGLGLAICRQIVNTWGGEIWAESKGKNQGSAFHFTIPIYQDNSTLKTATKKNRKKQKSKG
ncbi:MAG: ATP-binding protein [Geminocystis sp.]|nr:ATP-binding protein [Geminocystis sp.]HIK38241.1 GAF domain-containing protein [Geminocystis sp. M7585_C2015_104]MCS7146634.1 ATP-binding protein [Geminocystis sp.]MCX8077217.1 ATP-binding protein [Geminocystis sp.]MDW8115460.1 DICT sensory domain-containing protein [Geminocystis sp.]